MSGHLFRTRLSRELVDKTAKFHSSVIDDLRMFEDDINGTEAHDIMLYEQGVIPLESLKKILKTLEDIRREWQKDKLEVGADYEDIHEYVEAKVIEALGIDEGGMIHTGRSRNDQVATDIRLRLREEILEVAEAINKLNHSLLDLANDHVETIMILYTHGQHAQIGTFSHYLMSYLDFFLRDSQRLLECYVRVNMNPLGAGPIGGTSINIERWRTTELLGFDGIVNNSIDATSGRDWALETASTCAILMGNMSKVASDLILWSTLEYNYIEIADEYSTSSSIMPQKKNPSTLELIRGKTSEVYGAMMELFSMVKGLPSGYYQDLQQTKPPLWRILDAVKTSLETMIGVMKTLKVNEDKMRERVESSSTQALELVELLTMETKLSFREAYKITAALVKQTIEEEIPLANINLEHIEKIIERLHGKKIEINGKLVAEGMRPRTSLMRRKSKGSPHPEEVKGAIKERGKQLKIHADEVKRRREKVDDALKKLRKTVLNIIQK